jgi:hypothetical protein
VLFGGLAKDSTHNRVLFASTAALGVVYGGIPPERCFFSKTFDFDFPGAFLRVQQCASHVSSRFKEELRQYNIDRDNGMSETDSMKKLHRPSAA